jgi:hypothetical protein
MSFRNLILIIVTVVVIFAAIAVTQKKAPETNITKETLYPNLIDELNGVERIEIRSRENQSILRKQGDGWTMENRDDFPARFNDVKRSLIQLAELKVVEAKTSDPEKYDRLGVEDVDAEDSGSTLVTVSGTSGEPYVSLIVGNEKKGGAAHYVRRLGQAQAALAEGELELPADPNEWIDTAIADIQTKRIHRMRIHPLDGDPVVTHKSSPKDNFFDLENVPDGYTVKSKATVSSLGALLLDLRFTDVAAASTIGDDIVPRTVVVVETFDGLIAAIEQLDYEDKVFARFSYEFNPEVLNQITAAHPPAETPDEPETDEAAALEATAPDPAAEDAPSIEEEVKALNAVASGWIFVLPDYKNRLIDKRMDDLIKVYEPPPPPLEPDEPE